MQNLNYMQCEGDTKHVPPNITMAKRHARHHYRKRGERRRQRRKRRGWNYSGLYYLG